MRKYFGIVGNAKYMFCSSASGSSLKKVNAYLLDALNKQNIHKLKGFQEEILNMSLDRKQNIFINSCTGSGKTLSYFLPILNDLYNSQEQKQKINGDSEERDLQHGAVILTLNKELCLQVYRNIRLLDPENRLNVKRTGPITHYIPVISELNAGPKTEEDGNYIDYKINENLVNTVKWSKTDVIISTPQLLWNIISMGSGAKNRELIMPKFLVVDEADILIAIDRNVSRFTDRIVDEVKKNVKEVNKKTGTNLQLPQIFVSASSFPPKIDKIPYKEALNKKFGEIVEVSGQSKHKIPPTIDLFFIEMYEMPENKEYYLLDIIKSRPGDRAIIFCNSKKTADELSSLIKTNLEVNSEVYHASLDSNERSRVLHRFESNISKILISTDLGSRGLDFSIPVHYIVEYEMAENITSWLNRVGRTGRNGVKGELITMVDENNKEIFSHLQEIVSEGEQLDGLFSRKRSYHKLYKK